MRVTARLGRSAILVNFLTLAGCAAARSDPVIVNGISGVFTWEITDVGQLESIDGRRMRWSYLINVKAPPGEGIQMEHVEIGMSSPGEMIGAPQGAETPLGYTVRLRWTGP